MYQDKAVQTSEDDFDEIIDTPQPSPVLEDEIELAESIHDILEDYIKDEVIHMSKESFMTQLNDDIAHILFQTLIDAEICSPDEYWLGVNPVKLNNCFIFLNWLMSPNSLANSRP
jgi:hypothetical protein